MPNPANTSQLHPLISQGVELLRRLETLLADERTALEKRDLAAIEQTTTEKAKLLGEIQENFNARHEILSSLGIELSAEGWKHYLSTLPAEAADMLNEQWIELSKALERTQKASLINQQIVKRGQENTTRLLNLLQGKNQKSQLYGASGQSNNFSTQSRIGKA